MEFKNSVMAFKDGQKKDKQYYHIDDNIFCIDIGQVLNALESDSDLYKNQTKEQLKKALDKQLAFYMDVLKEDFKFYADNVIPKFVRGLK